ncbi:OmpA family protein [Pseudomonas auratipiscis]|uniref:OmpA family protein n=1 Tax=Pseudomonas auratipiscis TaxID=3115853 RepID=A0AB35WWK6_9PSED|nr:MULTISPECIES: OmpA family protein [unclassified Pseudomonas]MEE1868018.1 OmpA family protein [Pseudomonas sp. 120P]MEE1959111.1 OmpA family protein [Pseudomonas sp. 119P]
MEQNTLKLIVQVAGVGGLGLSVLLIIYREIIRKNIFPTLGKSHAYKIIMTIIGCTFIVSLAGLSSWVWIQTHPRNEEREANPWDRLDGEYKLMLLDLAKQGCYFFKWNNADILQTPDFVYAAQAQYVNEKIAAVAEQDRLIMVGFAESGGPDAYAQKLSERYADNAKRYIVNTFNIPDNEIATVGVGHAGNSPRVDDYFCGAKLIHESELNEIIKK